MSDRMTRRNAIRAKCLSCCGGVLKEVRECPVHDCALYRYRMGSETDYVAPRYVAPAHLPVWEGGRVVSPEERSKSCASVEKSTVAGKQGGSRG